MAEPAATGMPSDSTAVAAHRPGTTDGWAALRMASGACSAASEARFRPPGRPGVGRCVQSAGGGGARMPAAPPSRSRAPAGAARRTAAHHWLRGWPRPACCRPGSPPPGPTAPRRMPHPVPLRRALTRGAHVGGQDEPAKDGGRDPDRVVPPDHRGHPREQRRVDQVGRDADQGRGHDRTGSRNQPPHRRPGPQARTTSVVQVHCYAEPGGHATTACRFLLACWDAGWHSAEPRWRSATGSHRSDPPGG